MLHICPANQLMYRYIEILCFFQLIRKLHQDVCDNRVQRRNRTGGRRHTEFKLIPGESERRCPVSVGGITFQVRQGIYANTHPPALGTARCFPMLNLVENINQLVAKEYGNNRRRSLLRAKAVVIAGA